MPKTYEPISTQTLASQQSSVTFSSIPATYTDLVLIVNPNNIGITSFNIYFNGDTAANYSCTRIYGEGANAYSDRTTNSTLSLGGWGTGSGSNPFLFAINIMNYTNTNMWKTALTNVSELTGGYVGQVTTLWRNTSAITSVAFTGNANMGVGSKFTLYGIKGA